MSRHEVEIYDRLSEVLSYPEPDYHDKVDRCAGALRRQGGDAAAAYSQFALWAGGMTVNEMEELFTRTFDLDPACCLEVGWHLYGEHYERGRLLVRMRQELNHVGLKESVELPDHLSHVLPALARMEPQRAADFVEEGVLPALEKMIGALKGRDNPYEGLLRTVRAILEASVPAGEEVAHG